VAGVDRVPLVRYRSDGDQTDDRNAASRKMRKGALETPSVQSVDRVLTILEAVAKSSSPVTLAQLTDLLGINQSSVFRLANTLKRRGFLANPNSRKSYVLGPAIWRMSRNYEWSGMLVGICHEHLKTLGERTGETAHLGVREGREVLFVDHCASTGTIVVPAHTGALMPLYCTAHGKALLCDYTQPELKALLGAAPLKRYTETTITSVAALERACAKVRVDGYATDEAEYREEVRCLAAPIRDQDGMTIAAIGISAPASRFPKARMRSLAEHVCQAALDINAELQAASA
jgi:DNA-binding IclR family transcriptional regulator